MPHKKDFWNQQYRKPTHLELSDEPAEDLVKFCRFIERRAGRALMNVTMQAVDIGCGNGRNLIYLAQTYGMRGFGYDLSKEAIAQAQRNATAIIYDSSRIPVRFEVQDLREPIPLPDASCSIALDMMSSHILKKDEREALLWEVLRVLRPGGWLFFKSFIREDDANAERMLRDYPAEEEGMYVHPEIGAPEKVWAVPEIKRFFGDFFTIHKIEKSYKHRHKDGSPWKRRTASAYLEKR